MIATQEQIETTVIDGLIINVLTGEIVGEEKPEFRVTDEASAEWVLEKILNAEADAAREQIKLNAVKERLEANIKASKARAEFFTTKYANDLEDFARTQLEGAKTRTLKLTWGSLSFRTTKGGLRVADPEKALAWAKDNAPEAVKVSESFLISQVPDETKAMIMSATPHDQEARGFTLVPDSESFSIKTGVNS